MVTAVPAAATAQTDRVLDPIARTSEVLFGLIMALTFTGTFSAATAGREEVRTLLIGMIACNIAWGLVDAVMFLMSSMTERGHNRLMIRGVHDAPPQHGPPHRQGGASARRGIDSVDGGLRETATGPSPHGGAAGRAGLTREDWLGAVAVFLLVFFSTFPVVIPFLLFSTAQVALRVSNLIALVMLFCLGYWLGQHGGYPPWHRPQHGLARRGAGGDYDRPRGMTTKGRAAARRQLVVRWRVHRRCKCRSLTRRSSCRPVQQ